MHAATLNALASFPDQLAAFYAEVPQGYETFVPESWEGVPSEALSPLAQLCHVRDIEIDGYHVRLQRTLDEERPLLASIDTDGLAIERDYAHADATQALAAFRIAREQTLALIRRIEPPQWDRTAVFEGYGALTLRSLVHYLASHDQQHLAGLQWLLGKIDAARAASAIS
jgi:hypothetical protein